MESINPTSVASHSQELTIKSSMPEAFLKRIEGVIERAKIAYSNSSINTVAEKSWSDGGTKGFVELDGNPLFSIKLFKDFLSSPLPQIPAELEVKSMALEMFVRGQDKELPFLRFYHQKMTVGMMMHHRRKPNVKVPETLPELKNQIKLQNKSFEEFSRSTFNKAMHYSHFLLTTSPDKYKDMVEDASAFNLFLSCHKIMDAMTMCKSLGSKVSDLKAREKAMPQKPGQHAMIKNIFIEAAFTFSLYLAAMLPADAESGTRTSQKA